MANKIIAVQTFWRSQFNYGQLLQGYALQKFLIDNGHDSYIIRFDSVLSRMKELIILLLRRKLFSDFKQKRLRGFGVFRDKNMRFSKRHYGTYRSLKNHPPKADVYIVGSDQVWAYMRNPERRNAYLLQFGGKSVKKIAYAASFGRDALADDSNDYLNALKDFAYLGVREESGKDICMSLGLDSSWVTDPVTLLSSLDWRKLKVSIELDRNHKNVFFYTLTNVQQNRSYSEVLTSLQKQYTVYYTNSSELLDENCKFFPSPNEWLAYIDECDCVITDSFHCTMFCIIFNKPFVTLVRGDGSSMSNRLTSMLERVGLIDRYIGCAPKNVNSVLLQSIDWKSVNFKLEEWVNYSKQQLLNAL